MSVIAARVLSDCIEIASDSIIIKDDLKCTYKKLRQINNMIIGGCGDADELNMMFVYAKKHKPETATDEGVLKFISGFREYKMQLFDKDLSDNEYFLAYKGVLFVIDGTFVEQVSDYLSIGAGSKYAHAALEAGCSATRSVEVACKLCCYTAGPVEGFKMSIN